MSQIKVSVIIPVYNMVEYLEECLESVVSQTLREKEIICINDGSTDDSIFILKQYQLRYDNIVIINQENMGAAQARNAGLRRAAGEFAAFMDPDDCYPDSDVLEHLYHMAISHNVRICGGSWVFWENGVESTDFTGHLEGLNFKQGQVIQYKDYQIQYGYQKFIFQIKMIRNNDLYFPPYRRYQDPPFLVKTMLAAGEFYGTPKMTYKYRIGHKKLCLTEKILLDVYKGFWDLLSISKKENLARLHTYVVEEIHSIYYPYFFKGAMLGTFALRAAIMRINEEIDVGLLALAGSPWIEAPAFGFAELADQKVALKERLVRPIKKAPATFLYGAGYVGKGLDKYLKVEENLTVAGFVVTEKGNNQAMIRGIPVWVIDEVAPYYQEALFVVAVQSDFRDELLGEIRKRKIKRFLLLEDGDVAFLKQYARGINDDMD